MSYDVYVEGQPGAVVRGLPYDDCERFIESQGFPEGWRIGTHQSEKFLDFLRHVVVS